MHIFPPLPPKKNLKNRTNVTLKIVDNLVIPMADGKEIGFTEMHLHQSVDKLSRLTITTYVNKDSDDSEK